MATGDARRTGLPAVPDTARDLRFRAWVSAEADGRTRLVVSRCMDGGMRVGAPALDRFPDAAEEADDLLAEAGWRRTGPWWLVPSGAAAAVVPAASPDRAQSDPEERPGTDDERPPAVRRLHAVRE